jgi:hypothetical protein
MAKYDHGGGCACGLYRECLDDCEHNETKTENIDIRLMNESRDFPNNTCPASRHVQMIAETLAAGEKYHMLDEELEHCAGSLASVVSSLYQTRTFLKSLGYDWRIGEDRTVEWYRADNGDYLGRARRDNMTNPGNLDYDT